MSNRDRFLNEAWMKKRQRESGEDDLTNHKDESGEREKGGDQRWSGSGMLPQQSVGSQQNEF